MRTIPFKIDRVIVTPQHDSVYLGDAGEIGEQLVESVIEAISTDIMITAGGVKSHLAMWQSPDHWSSDWRELGVEDFYEWAEGLVVEK